MATNPLFTAQASEVNIPNLNTQVGDAEARNMY